MIGVIAAATVIGMSVYVWLTVSVLPVTHAVRATRRSRRAHTQCCALPLAIGVSALAAAAAFASAIVVAMCAPRAGALLGDPAGLAVGVLTGLLVWSARSALLGAPRLSSALELALVLAVVSLKSDDAMVLSMVERDYRGQMLDSGDRYLPPVPRTVLGV